MNPHASRPLGQLLPLGLLALTLVGCPKDIPPPENAITDPILLRSAVEARVEETTTARFKDVVLDYYGEKDRIKVRQLILVRPPQMLRVQTKLPGGDEVLNLLVSDGTRFSMHQRDTNEYITGPPTKEHINRLLPLNMSASDVVRVMLGGAPLERMMAEGGPFEMSWNRRTGRYDLFVATTQGGRLVAQVRANDFGVVSFVEEDAQGEALYTYETEDWERFGETSLPRSRRFIWPGQNLDFSLDVGETQLNVDLPETLFRFPPPPGSRVIEVGP